MANKVIPDRGDVINIISNGKSLVQAIVVLSPHIYNGRVNAVLCCPIVSSAKGYPFEVDVPPGLPVQGVILSDHVCHTDLSDSSIHILCTLPHEAVEEVIKKAKVLFDI